MGASLFSGTKTRQEYYIITYKYNLLQKEYIPIIITFIPIVDIVVSPTNVELTPDPRSLTEIQFRDIIAIMILAGLFTLKYLKYDGMVDASIALVIGYYFSKRVYEEKQGGE